MEDSWKLFFSSLAYAEKAAADQCLFISEYFKRNGDLQLAKTYKDFSEEEMGHYKLVCSIVGTPMEIPSKAMAVYSGSLLRNTSCVIERLAAVHLAFEPSALAFLGHIVVNTHKYFKDSVQAENIKQSFSVIIKEEVHHIFSGKELVLKLLKSADAQTKKNVRDSLRLHKAFLSLGLKTFFKENPETENFIESMLKNYQVKFENISQEILA